MLKQTLILVVALALTTPALAQITPTNGCTGQPTGTPSDSGDQTLNPAIPLGATDLMTLSGGGCSEVGGPDSVWCFVPTSTCNASFTLSPDGQVAASISVVNWGVSPCSETVTNCNLGSLAGSNGDSVTVGPVSVPAGQTICVYGATTAGTGTFTTSGLDGCGALPVEVQSFTVNDDETDPAPENDPEP